MIEKIVLTVLGRGCYDALKNLFKVRLSSLELAFNHALDATKAWYAEKYGDQYGAKNNRFYDYQSIEAELVKLIFYMRQPDMEMIKQFVKDRQIDVPPDVVLSFVDKLNQELEKIPECEAVLAERDKLVQVKSVSQNTAETATHTRELVRLKREELAIMKGAVRSSCPAGNKKINVLDWRKLFDAFKRRQLDKIIIKQIGEGKDGPEMLALAKAFFEQDVSTRSIVLSSLPGKEDNHHETLSQFMQQADIWQSYLWRYLQEHRLKERLQDHHGREIDEAQFVQVVGKLVSLAKDKPGRLSSQQFDRVVDQTAQGLELTIKEIVDLLSWYFGSVLKREPVLEALKHPCSVLLIGDAGSGKTTAMRKMCLDLFQALDAEDSAALPIPVFVRLDNIYDYLKPEQPIKEAASALLDYVCDHWQKDLIHKTDLCRPVLENSSHPIQLVLDGLDEVGSVAVRRTLAKAVSLLRQKSYFHIIVTSRPAAIDQSLLALFELHDYQLMELTEKQTTAFVDQFFRIYKGGERSAGRQDAAAFKLALADTEAAQEFGTNPLYLTIMMLMHKKHEVLPQRRIELYQEFINMLLSQRQSEPVHGKVGIKPVFKVAVPGRRPVEWGDTTYRKLLYRIAYDTHADETDSVSITGQRVLDAIRATRLMRQVKQKNEHDLAREFIDFCDEKLGLLISRGPFYGFSHRSIQEYFAASRLAELEKGEVVQFWKTKALKRPDLWYEVVRLLFCLIRGKDYCFEFLEQQWPKDIQAASSPQSIKMIAAALFDLQGFHPNYDGEIYELYDLVKQALVDWRGHSIKNPQMFLSCGDALGLLGEPAIETGDPPSVVLSASEPFMMGDDEIGEEPVHPVRLSPFWIDKYPVTNKQFAEFVAMGGYEDPDNWADLQSRFAFDGRKVLDKNKWTAPSYWRHNEFGKKRPLAPVVGISWFEAMAYCRWWTKTFGRDWAKCQGLDGRIETRLPTEAEWEFAARGHGGKPYPWGREESKGQTMHANIEMYFGRTTAVGSFPSGATKGTGLMDMAGNVWEWCFDWFDDRFYENSTEQDPVCTKEQSGKVLRGGSWGDHRGLSRCACRFRIHPLVRDSVVGFRCVRTE